MASLSKLASLAFNHRRSLHQAYSKNGTDWRAHTQDATNAGYAAGTAAVTAPLRAWENIPRLVLRGLQFLLALVIVGIYGVRVGDGRRHSAEASPAWWFGMVVGVLSCLSALVLALAAPLALVASRFKTHHLFGWDLVFFLLWIIVFAIFEAIFRHRSSDDPYKGSSTAVEKAAAWLDLVNALLWLLSGVYGGVKTWLGRRRDALKDRVQHRLLYGDAPGPVPPVHAHSYSNSSSSNSSDYGSEKGDYVVEDAHQAATHVAEPEPVYHQARGFVFAGR